LYTAWSTADYICRYHSDTEVSLTMPWLLGRQPGPFLVQVSLNSSEFSEPHERCIFCLFRDHRTRDRDYFPRPTGPRDVNTSRAAIRKLNQLEAARHRRLAHSNSCARNNDIAYFQYLSAVAQPHEARPSIRSILQAAVTEVDDKGLVDMSEVMSLARMQEVPFELLHTSIPSYDQHPLLCGHQSEASPTHHLVRGQPLSLCASRSHKQGQVPRQKQKAPASLSLIQKLHCLLNDRNAQQDLLRILNKAFFLLTDKTTRTSITYAELCEQVMLVPLSVPECQGTIIEYRK